MGIFGPPNVGKLREKSSISGLIKALNYKKDADIRKDAAMALGALGNHRAIEPLIAALNDESSDVRSAAAEGLGEIDDTRAIEPLVAALNDEDDKVLSAIAEALGKIGDTRAIELLGIALKDNNSNVRKAAAETLGVVCDSKAIELLINSLTDEDESVRDTIVKLLGDVGNADTVKVLFAHLGSDKFITKDNIIFNSINRINDPKKLEVLVDLLLDGPPGYYRDGIAELLGEIGNAYAIYPLLKYLNRRFVHEVVRESGYPINVLEAVVVKEALEDIGINTEFLIKALKEEDSEIRAGAALMIGKKCNKDIIPEAIDALKTALKDSSEIVRTQSIWTLGKINEKQAICPEIFIDALKESSKVARLVSIETLKKIRDIKSITPLIQTLHDPDEEVCAKVAGMLWVFKDSQAVEPLAKCLDSQNEEVVYNAAISLNYLGSSRSLPCNREIDHYDKVSITNAVDSLIKQLYNKDWSCTTHRAIIQALGKSCDDKVIPHLTNRLYVTNEEEVKNCGYAIDSLGELGSPRAVKLVINYISSLDLNLMYAYRLMLRAGYAIAKIGTPALDELTSALKEETDHFMCGFLIDTLAAIDNNIYTLDDIIRAKEEKDFLTLFKAMLASSPCIQPSNRKIQDEPAVRSEAVTALAQIRDPIAVPYLFCVLQRDNDAYVRSLAPKALGDLGSKEIVDDLVSYLKSEKNGMVALEIHKALKKLN